MTSRSKADLTKIWTLLIALSLTGVFVARYHGAGAGGVAVILTLAVVKCRLILLDFMGLRGLWPPLRWALLGWCVLIAALALAKVLILPATGG